MSISFLRRTFKRIRTRLFPLLFSVAFLISIVLGSGASHLAHARETPFYDQLVFPPVGNVNIPDYEHYDLANGITVYLVEDHTLPFVDGQLILRTGQYLVSPEQTGLAAITGEAMRLGGTVNHAPADLNQRLAQRAASISTGISQTRGVASFSTGVEALEETVELFSEVLSQPAFDQEQISLITNATAASIARQNDNPQGIANREWTKLIYGDNSPYARTVTYDSLENISREAVSEFYQQTVTPDGAVLGIIGDFDTAQMKALIDRTLGSWEAKETRPSASLPLPPLPPTPLPQSEQQSTGIFVIDQPHLTQSSVIMGHLGDNQRNPHTAAMFVLNEVLNGVSGRLFSELRSRQELTYGSHAYWAPGYIVKGVFNAGGSTRSETTVPFIQAMSQQIERLRQEPISAAELAEAKDKWLNSFVFDFETPEQTLYRLINYDFFGYPLDYIFQLREQVEHMTAQQVLAAAQATLAPEDMVTLVVGNMADVGPELETLGLEITPIDVSLPTPLQPQESD